MICNKCFKDIKRGSAHYVVRVGDTSITLKYHMHVPCYLRFKETNARDLKWAVLKHAKN